MGKTRVKSASRSATIAGRTATAAETVFDTSRERIPLFSANRGYSHRDGCHGRVTERQRWPKRCLTPDRPAANRVYGFRSTCNCRLLSPVVEARRGTESDVPLTIAAAARGGPPGRG